MASHVETSELAVDDLRRRARRRLVGAAILALAAAVLLPLLLESEPKPLGDDVSIQIPSQETGLFTGAPSSLKRLGGRQQSPTATSVDPASDATSAAPKEGGGGEATVRDVPRVTSADSKASSTDLASGVAAPARSDPPVASSASMSTSGPPQAPPSSASAVSVPALKNSEKTVGTAPVAVAPVKAPAAEGFVVQLAAFADPGAAKALVGQLKSGGFSAYVEPLATSRGSVHRVRVGPYASREAAEAAQAKLKRGGHKGIVARAGR